MNIAVKSEHIEENIHCQNFLAWKVEQVCWKDLLLCFVSFKELGLHINKVKRFFVFSLFC